MPPGVPQLDYGYPLRYVWWLDCAWAVAMGYLTGDDVAAVFETAAGMLPETAAPGDNMPLGQIRLTTTDPRQPGTWAPRWGLRSGEFVRCAFVPSTFPWGDPTRGATGLSPNRIDRNPSLRLPNECYLAIGGPLPDPVFRRQYGAVVVRECLLTSLPSWGALGNMAVENDDPANVLFRGGCSPSSSLYPSQTKGLALNIARVRGQGQRLLPTGIGPVDDGGRPAWPPQ